MTNQPEVSVRTGDQEWQVAWHPAGPPPGGTPHGSTGVCVTPDGGIVLVSDDGVRWDFPAGRPEGSESWEETLRREVLEEACAAVREARLLGYTRGRCVRGREEGKVLVRAFWRAEVDLRPWEPEFEIPHRRVVTPEEAAAYLTREAANLPFHRRALSEAGFLVDGLDFTDEAARAAWSSGAAAWEAAVESGADYYRHEVHGPGLLAACEPVAGLEALDLGCGQGFFSRQLARRGARVAGVDLSTEMIALAREHEARDALGIEYRAMSATAVGDAWGGERFDLVTACMSLQDMADPAGALRAAFAVLRPGGRMVISVPHPASDTPYREWERDETGRKLALKVDRYFDTGPAVCHWTMSGLPNGWDTPYRRCTLAEWSGLVADAGFLVERIHEPRPTDEQVRRMPELDDSHRVPYFLVFRLVKPDRPIGPG